MSDEPRTHKLDAHELMKFLDQLAPDVTEEQRAQLVFVDQRVQRVDARMDARMDAQVDARALRVPSSHPFAHARLAHIEPAHEPARERPIELTMLDAERVLDAELFTGRWASRPLRRAVLGGVAGVMLFALLAFAAARSRDQHASGGRPPPLPHPPSGSTEPPLADRGAHVGTGSGMHSADHASAAAVPQAAEHKARSSDPAPAANTRASTREVQRGLKEAAGERPHAEVAAAARHDGRATAALAPGRTAEVGSAPPLGARRNAVDLLLAGESRAALDAYRALTGGGAADPALAQVVRLLELELSTCGAGEAASCRQ